MKKIFNAPELEIIVLTKAEDVVTASGGWDEIFDAALNGTPDW